MLQHFNKLVLFFCLIVYFLFSALNPTVNVISRRKLSRNLVDDKKRLKTLLRIKIENLSHICLTADIWSTRHRSFLGVTVHWVSVHTSVNIHFEVNLMKPTVGL